VDAREDDTSPASSAVAATAEVLLGAAARPTAVSGLVTAVVFAARVDRDDTEATGPLAAVVDFGAGDATGMDSGIDCTTSTIIPSVDT